MFKSFAQKVSRKRINKKNPGDFQDLVTLRSLPSTTEGYAHRSAGCINPASEAGPQDVSLSAAGFHAHDPQADQHVLQATSTHIFTAVFTQSKPARGSLYLRQHLYMELLAQLPRHRDSLSEGLQAAINVLDNDYKNLNPTSNHILEGVEAAVAFLDFKSGLLYIFSNGGCRCIVGRKTRNGVSMQLLADVGQKQQKEPTEIASLSEIRVISISRRQVDIIILGSAGFWQEAKPANVLLRGQCHQQIAPQANASACAAHLVNYGLQCITDRLKGSSDLRMSSLKSVNNLVSLQTGDKSQYKWGSRQPVRRRRGDVHKDLTVVALQLHWDGRQGSFEGDTKKTRQALVSARQGQVPRHSHWNLVRLHFVEFPHRLRQLHSAMPHDLTVPAVVASEEKP